MKNVFEVARQEGWHRQTWLVVGKGPTFSQYRTAETLPRMALNHAVTRLPSAQVTHCVDIEVVRGCGTKILGRSRYLLMPRIPNVALDIGSRTLAEHAEEYPVLRRLAGENRLLWYNRREAPPHAAGSPPISVIYFSAEGAIGVLAEAGVKRIRTAGVDGGRNYSSEFAGLQPLANGRPSFDAQFQRINAIVNRYGIDYAPAGGAAPA